MIDEIFIEELNKYIKEKYSDEERKSIKLSLGNKTVCLDELCDEIKCCTPEAADFVRSLLRLKIRKDLKMQGW